MTTWNTGTLRLRVPVVEAYRLDRYDNTIHNNMSCNAGVVEAYRLDRYDNLVSSP